MDMKDTCFNPANGHIIGHVPVNRPEDVYKAVEKARSIQAEWSVRPIKVRVEFLRKLREFVTLHADELADTISRDNGKTRLDALITEIVPAAMAADYYRRRAPRFLRDRKVASNSLVFANKSSKIVHAPYGVIAIISPWNYPFAIPFSEIAMALVAGNAVIVKVAGATQLVGRILERCFLSVGLPEGLFSYVNLPGKIAGRCLLDAGVDKLFFTGSESVGKELMAAAAPYLTPLVLELGGNDPMLVCPDADVERAAAGAVWAGMQNSGQSCGGVERIYIDRKLYNPFLEALARRVKQLRIGEDNDHELDIGAITTAEQLREIRRQVDAAVAAGAVVHAQSTSKPPESGWFFPAMVLTEVDHTMDIMRQETFGPVVGVMPVSNMAQAIELANDTTYGLTASVWTADRKMGEKLARQIKAGVVMINDHLASHGLANTPWGGFKRSGFGRTHGEAGIMEMTQIQCIVDDGFSSLKRNLWWHPHGRSLYEGLRGLLEMLYHPRKTDRLRGLWRLIKIVPRIFKSG